MQEPLDDDPPPVLTLCSMAALCQRRRSRCPAGVRRSFAAATMPRVNFAREISEATPPRQLALLELARDGTRREWSFGELAERTARLSRAHCSSAA